MCKVKIITFNNNLLEPITSRAAWNQHIHSSHTVCSAAQKHFHYTFFKHPSEHWLLLRGAEKKIQENSVKVPCCRHPFLNHLTQISFHQWAGMRNFTFFWPLKDHWAKSWSLHSSHRNLNTPLQQNYCGSLTGSFPTLTSKHCIWVRCLNVVVT